MNISASITDKANALNAVESCQAVYTSDSLATDECHVLFNPVAGHIEVFFRGSKSIQDWMDDAEFPKITVAGGKVHEGIWQSYFTIDQLLRAHLAAFPKLPLIIGGHSLGGGHAQFCAYNLDGEFEIAQVITFGGPRIGDASFAESYNRTLKEKTVRWVDARDIVPRVPFREMGFEHVGHEAFLKSSGGMAFDPGIFELLHDDVVGGLADIKSGKLELLADHHLERYRARLESLPDV